MGSDVKHSPTPWRVEKNLYGTANIIETDGRQIAACAAECQSADLDGDAKQDEANAAYIVECVNSHDRLVAENARLRDLVRRMKMSVKYHRAATGDYEILAKQCGWKMPDQPPELDLEPQNEKGEER